MQPSQEGSNRARTPGGMQLSMREVGVDDVNLLFDWSNDPATRKNSFSPEPIPFDTHQHWFRELLQDPGQRAYLLLEAEPVGLVRFRIQQGEPCQAVLSYSIAPQHRGRGLAAPLLNLGTEKLRLEVGVPITITAKVKNDNQASLKALTRAGFFLKSSDLEETALQRTLSWGFCYVRMLPAK